MKSNPTQTDDFYRKAFQLWIDCGKNTTQAAKKAGVARTTFVRWLEKAGALRKAESVAPNGLAVAPFIEANCSLMEHTRATAHEILEVIRRRAPEEKDTGELRILVHSLTADHQMMAGAPGQITRNENLTAGFNFDPSKLSPKDLRNLADLMERGDPQTHIVYPDPEAPPVIAEVEGLIEPTGEDAGSS